MPNHPLSWSHTLTFWVIQFNVISTYQKLDHKSNESRLAPPEVPLDSEMGRRPIRRCLFAARGATGEVHHLTFRISAPKQGQTPSAGAFYGKMTRHWLLTTAVRVLFACQVFRQTEHGAGSFAAGWTLACSFTAASPSTGTARASQTGRRTW